MSEIERLALAVAMLTERVNQLHREMQDLKDLFRSCACFGTAD